jgi:molybdopterin-binding protein
MGFDVAVPAGGSRLLVEGLELPPGKTTVIFGPNGAGKSTLLRYLAGLGSGPGLGSVSYLQQRPYMFRGTAGHNLGLGLDSEEAARARQVSDRLGVGDLLAHDAPTLSGGERHRLALARAVAAHADWLLLDEPLAPVDLADRHMILGLLSDEFEFRNVVLVTHDIDVVASLADHLVVLDRGRLIEQGPVAEVIGSPSGVRSAEILGKANLIDGLARLDSEVCVLSNDSVEIYGVGSAQGKARALFGAEALTLRLPGTGGATSARNTWIGSVETILDRGQLIEIAIDIGVRLVAVITPGALADLSLAPGGQVEVSVKASAVRIVQS